MKSALRLVFLPYAFWILGLGAIAAQQPDHRIYSDVRYIEEAGDLLGSELELDFKGEQVQGFLRFYEGGCGTPVAVNGTHMHDQILLSGQSDEYGKIEIMGHLEAGKLTGTLVQTRQANSERTHLKLLRISKAHCSD
jgi:hypothetical protein